MSATKTLLPVTVVDIEATGSGVSARGPWTRHALTLAPADADLSGAVNVIEADTFADNLPEIGATVRVVIEAKKRVVGDRVYENRTVTRFIPHA